MRLAAIDPTTYGLGVILSSPLIWIGLLLIGGGSLTLAWMFRGPLGYYEPEIPAVIQPPTEDTLIHPAQPIAPNYHRSGEYPVVARIPGATPEVPKERTDEMDFAATIAAAEEQILAAVPPPPSLAPQFAALGRFFEAVDQAHADTSEALQNVVENLRPDCPLTTQEIPPLLDAPLYDAAIRNTDTRELSEVMKKVKQA